MIGRLLLWLSLAGLATGAAVAIAASGNPAGPHLAAAQSEAARLVTLVQLPAGARPAAGPPSSDLAGAPGGIIAPQLVDRTAFFTVPGTPESVVAFMRAHPPAGGRPGDSGSAAPGPEQWISFEFGPVRTILADRLLEIAAVALDSSTVGVRVDAQVAPLPVLPAGGGGPGHLRVVEAQTMLGSFGWELRCDPAGGTVPNPRRVCAAIRRHPRLLYSFPGSGHPCPFGAPDVSLSGTWHHRGLRSSFSVCIGGQERVAGEWASLLPSQRTLGAVHPGRGIGMLSIGESEAAVIDLLRGAARPPRPCADCRRFFSSGYRGSHGPVGWWARFAGGRLESITTNAPDTFIGRTPLFVSVHAVRRALPGWTALRCVGTTELYRAGTLIIYRSGFWGVTVGAAPPTCP